MSTQAFECPCSKDGSVQAASFAPFDAAGFSPRTADTTCVELDAIKAGELATTDPQDLVAMGYAIEEGHKRLVNEVRAAIKARANETPWKTFRYAMAYGHVDIADAAAPYTVGRLPTKDQCIHDLPPVEQLAWYNYREQYLLLLDAAFTQPPPHKNTKRKLHDCGGWEPYAAAVLGDFPEKPLFAVMDEVATRGAENVFSRSRWEIEILLPGWDTECLTCRERAEKWEGAVNRRFRRLETFSTILERLKPGPGNG